MTNAIAENTTLQQVIARLQPLVCEYKRKPTEVTATAIYDSLYVRLSAFCWKFFQPTEVDLSEFIEDFLADFLTKHIESYDCGRPLVPFFLRLLFIAKNSELRRVYARRKIRKLFHDDINDIPEPLLKSGASNASEWVAILAAKLATIPDKDYTIFSFLMDGVKAVEIAELLGIPESQVWTSIYRTRRMIVGQPQREGERG